MSQYAAGYEDGRSGIAVSAGGDISSEYVRGYDRGAIERLRMKLPPQSPPIIRTGSQTIPQVKCAGGL